MTDARSVIQAYIDTIDAASLGMEALSKLRGLFLAIEKLTPETPEINMLAHIGVYIADDVHNMLDCGREEAEQKLFSCSRHFNNKL